MLSAFRKTFISGFVEKAPVIRKKESSDIPYFGFICGALFPEVSNLLQR